VRRSCRWMALGLAVEIQGASRAKATNKATRRRPMTPLGDSCAQWRTGLIHATMMKINIYGRLASTEVFADIKEVMSRLAQILTMVGHARRLKVAEK
jgi:hypothetical protein